MAEVNFCYYFLVASHFRWCLDEEMLRKHRLIVPGDLFAKARSFVDGPGSKFNGFLLF